jgi:hypothetical protein
MCQNDLLAIGSIYLDNGISEYGAGLTHRHYDLGEDHVMVHETVEADVDVCKPHHINSLQPYEISPNSLYLNENLVFQGYEYDRNIRRPTLPNQFLHQLRALLIELGLERVIAIVPAPKVESGSSVSLVEHLVPEVQGMITTPKPEHDTIFDGSVTTTWTFARGDKGDIEIREAKDCEELASGLHKVK